jgi:hypothetical protein
MTLTWISRFFLLLVVAIYYMVGSFLVLWPQTVGIVGLDFVGPETTTAIPVWGGFFYGTAIDGVDDRQLGELEDESLGLTLAIIGRVCAWLGGRKKAEAPEDQ